MLTVKHPPSQMIWGAMSVNGTAALYFLPAGVTICEYACEFSSREVEIAHGGPSVVSIYA